MGGPAAPPGVVPATGKGWEQGEPDLAERIPGVTRHLSSNQLRDLNDEWRASRWYAPRDARELEEVLLA